MLKLLLIVFCFLFLFLFYSGGDRFALLSYLFRILDSDRPYCVTPTQTIPANIGSVVTMICDVAANPSNVTFHWRTKHRKLSNGAQPRANVTIKDKALKSRLEIRIDSEDDFGQYSCSAVNIAGAQPEPCFYNIYGEFYSCTIDNSLHKKNIFFQNLKSISIFQINFQFFQKNWKLFKTACV